MAQLLWSVLIILLPCTLIVLLTVSTWLLWNRLRSQAFETWWGSLEEYQFFAAQPKHQSAFEKVITDRQLSSTSQKLRHVQDSVDPEDWCSWCLQAPLPLNRWLLREYLQWWPWFVECRFTHWCKGSTKKILLWLSLSVHLWSPTHASSTSKHWRRVSRWQLWRKYCYINSTRCIWQHWNTSFLVVSYHFWDVVTNGCRAMCPTKMW